VKRHLLSAADLSREDAEQVLTTAEEMRSLADRPIKKLPALRGRTVVNLFFEDSTRTRISFEAAAKRLSADVINFAAKGSSLSKGESLKDTALTLEAMGADAVVVRHGASGAPHRLAHSGWVRSSVVNAGDGTHEHPTQALLDAFTMWRHLGSLDGRRVAVVGDVLHSRVADPMRCCCRRSAPRSPWWLRPRCCRSASRRGASRRRTTSTACCPRPMR
jgi:aspartate carbamoyltransferase catalytic subunit